MEKQKCQSLAEIRQHLDEIDRHMIELIALRQFYVDQVSHFKLDEAAVQAPARVEQVIAAVREYAQQQGLDADWVEQFYRHMIQHFIQRELKQIRP
ncbi:chorismate mutase [Acinetobacter larvae]|uniref:chorismate mutase n=1 Tax=Acinetobacter larvae TaxID=1789224 RepID=A0A1B2LVF9_9GAMM|nr:chorismate mutase [Acinetobacter larvae]AOA56931.1 chorismate mutase [Acinetobacter larvae]